MSKINLEAPFNSFQGKVCKHTKIIYKKMYGKQFTSQICNPHTDAPSAAQTEVRQKLSQAVKNANALSVAERAAYMAAFRKQTHYVSFHGYVVAQEYAKL